MYRASRGSAPCGHQPVVARGMCMKCYARWRKALPSGVVGERRLRGMSPQERAEANRQFARDRWHSGTEVERAERLRAMRAKVALMKEARQSRIDAIKLARGCIDCGYHAEPVALHFDHRDPKTKLFTIASAPTRNWASIEAEIAKCDVRCANCHAIRSVREGHVGGPRRYEDTA